MLVYALLGLLVGVFLNLAADRLPQRRSLLGAPRCSYCGQIETPPEWVSLISYLLLRGRCNHCGAPHPLRRPLLELGTMLFFAFLWHHYGPTSQLALTSIYSIILLLVMVIDLEHRLVLNVVIFPAILFAAVAGMISLGPAKALVGGAVGFGLFYLIALVKRGGMGAGDVKLATFIGLAGGFPEVIPALLISIFFGGTVALALVLLRIKTLKSYIPYGPFLVVGGLVALIYGPQIVAWYLGAYH